jgi:hypothetical protein
MFCSTCGHEVAPGQPVCPQCGRPAAPVIPPVPGFQFQLESYAGKVRALSVAWFVYATYSLLRGLAGLTFAQAFFGNHFGRWTSARFLHPTGSVRRSFMSSGWPLYCVQGWPLWLPGDFTSAPSGAASWPSLPPS